MSRGCDSAAVAGETFFTELDTAFKSCAKDLPTKADFPEWSGTNQPGERVPMIERVPNSCDSHTETRASPLRPAVSRTRRRR